MPRHPRRKSRSGIYHVIVRGANRQEIFHKEEDRLRFLTKLRQYKHKTGVHVLAWCLMDNHVHLLLKEKGKPVSELMKRLGVSYASYYNWTYGTNGHLFQDRFKSEEVETDGYLATVVRYIHMNPVKAGLVRVPEEYRWSSCRIYYGKRGEPVGILDPSFVLALFSPDNERTQKLFREFHGRQCDDKCLTAWEEKRVRMTDGEARGEILKVLGDLEIPQVKSLPGRQRDVVLRRVKGIDGVSQRQVARILGVSVYLVNRA